MAETNIKDIKHRIKSVESTRQITKAMELVASSKLKRAKERAEKTRPYFELLSKTISDISVMNTDFSSVYTTKREIKNTLYIVVAGDRGLAGGYNGNVFRTALSAMNQGSASVVPIGRKTCEYFAKREYSIVAEHPGIGEYIGFKKAFEIAKTVLNEFTSERADEIKIIYTKFISPLTQEVMQTKILPITVENQDNSVQEFVTYEPSAEEVFASIIPDYVSGIILGAVIESFASEQGARRTAMESANDNATQMIDDLTIRFNRARQTTITQEITEIVSGANANS